MELHWIDSDPIEIDNDLELPQFVLDDYDTDECHRTYKTGTSTSITSLRNFVKYRWHCVQMRSSYKFIVDIKQTDSDYCCLQVLFTIIVMCSLINLINRNKHNKNH